LTPAPAPARTFLAGYKLTDLTHTEITLCPKGQVAFYEGGARIPNNDQTNCIACADLDPTKWAHTFAPRKGECVA